MEDGTAVIEMAAAARAQTDLAIQSADPMRASSHGVGELMLAAVLGTTRIILGLGGSATNDAGAGMLTAGRALDGCRRQPAAAAAARWASWPASTR